MNPCARSSIAADRAVEPTGPGTGLLAADPGPRAFARPVGSGCRGTERSSPRIPWTVFFWRRGTRSASFAGLAEEVRVGRVVEAAVGGCGVEHRADQDQG